MDAINESQHDSKAKFEPMNEEMFDEDDDEDDEEGDDFFDPEPMEISKKNRL